MFREKIRLFNPEWFREPASKLESTLRTPYILKSGLNLFIRRLGFYWFISGLVIWILFDTILIAILFGLLISLTIELFTLKKYYETKALPKHLKNIELVKKLCEGSKMDSDSQLIKPIEKSVKLSTWGMVNITYVGVSAWGWEIVFRILFQFITNSKIHYSNLLIGFKNKATDSDQFLWEVAQEKNKENQKVKLEKYLSEYGSKVDDLEISKPTLREQPNLIKKLLELYSETESPIKLLKVQQNKRDLDTQLVLKNLKIPKSLFYSLLKKVQENVALREDRRYYQFIGDYYIRAMIIELGKRLSLKENEIFTKSWDNIKSKTLKVTK